MITTLEEYDKTYYYKLPVTATDNERFLAYCDRIQKDPFLVLLDMFANFLDDGEMDRGIKARARKLMKLGVTRNSIVNHTGVS